MKKTKVNETDRNYMDAELEAGYMIEYINDFTQSGWVLYLEDTEQ